MQGKIRKNRERHPLAGLVRQFCGIEIRQVLKGEKKDLHKLLLYIGGKHVKVSQKLAAFISILLDNHGHIIPYGRLFAVLNSSSSSGRRRLHVLRQYVWLFKRELVRHKARATIAVADEIGYGLCEIAGKQKRRGS